LSMKISMSLDPASIAAALNRLEVYRERLEAAPDEIDRRLSEIAAETAEAYYSPSVTVTAEEHGVRASGDDVVFQEFGAGARISDPYPGGSDVSIEIRRGAYSDLVGGEYAQSGYEAWHYGGREFRYVTPRNALFYGMEAAREKAAEVSREVIRG